jgi:glycosyltransferase involved in cell wall biosynthesis
MITGAADHDSPLPTVSVVIPAYNAAQTLEPCIRSLLAQDYPSSLFEIIVVDNGSSDGSDAILRRFEDLITVLKEPRRGAAAARNLGVRQARGDFVAFTDGDCEAAQSWLRSLVEAALAQPAAAFVGGPVKALRPTAPIELFSERLFNHRAALQDPRFPYAITGNMLVRRAFLIQIGLFDARFQRGHDTEMSFRALFEHRARFAYAPDAIIYHRNPPHLRALFWEGVKHGRGSAYVLARYGGMVGTTAFRRAIDGRRYRRICAGFFGWFRRLFRPGEIAKRDRGDCLYDAVYNAGKQVGTLAQASMNAFTHFSAPERATLGGGCDTAS